MLRLFQIAFFLTPLALAGQSRQLDLKLSDGARVTLIRERESLGGSAQAWYYLPLNLRISEEAGRPEFSFMTYRDDSLTPVKGGILHLLLVWGLDSAQLREAEGLLVRAVDSTAFIGGGILVDHNDEHPDVQIASNHNELGDILRASLKNAAPVPLMAGSKMALSFMFDAENAVKMDAAFKKIKPLRGIRFKINFALKHRLYPDLPPEALTLEGDFEQWVKRMK
jgi:hypothetical protein